MTIDKTANKLVMLTTDRQAVAEALGQIRPPRLNWWFAGPCPFPATSDQCSSGLYLEPRERNGRLVVFLMSDLEGYYFPESMEAELTDVLIQYDIVVFDIRTPENGHTGNRKKSLKNSRIDDVTMMERLIELFHHYEISFTPARSEPDGRTHSIEIRLADRFRDQGKHYTLFYRRDYLAVPVDNGAGKAK